ncbi:glutathione transferase [Pseudomonas sp. hsmgli-8]|uniref:Glutathione transferase n=1 Tax=Pseudomonas quercus TaxID=2722792 RepID=A0ABX0YB62_9PSED|nr:glutathione transferase [Pseudomonas sp. LY10J]NJO99508.1 glutathione transferase [Pseudomonas quercus]
MGLSTLLLICSHPAGQARQAHSNQEYPHENRRFHSLARQVQAWLRSDLLSIRQERSTLGVFYGAQSAPLSSAAGLAAEKLFYAAHALLKNNAEYLFDRWSIADVDLALMLNRLIVGGDPVPSSLVEYAQRQWARPSVQAWVNLRRPPLQV